MSNNIYDILKKIESLEAPKKTNLTESKMTTVKELHNESKKEKQTHKGTIAEAVAQVEQQLNEKYMGFKTKVDEQIKVFHKTSPGAEMKRFDKDSPDPAAAGHRKAAADAAKAARASGQFKMSRYGGKGSETTDEVPTKKGGSVIAAKNLGEGGLDPNLKTPNIDKQVGYMQKGYERDSGAMAAADADARGQAKYKSRTEPGIINKVKDTFGLDKPDPAYGPKTNEGAVEESGLQAYLGKKKYGETGMKALQKAGREGASKEKMAMIRAKHDKMDEGSYNEEMLSPKQKSFAALAEPKDKITYADKIAGAKKGKKTEGNKFSGNLMKARAQGLKQADLDGDGDMEPVRGGKKMGEAVGLDPNLKSPNSDRASKYVHADYARTGKYEPDVGTIGAWQKDVEGQQKYKSRTEPGIINKVKDTFGLDKPDPAYGPKDPTPMKEGRKSMREGWEEMQKYLEKKRGPESKGGEGKKAGTRYGGSAQKDDDDEVTDGEGKVKPKKRQKAGRPEGTASGARHSYKKPKD